MSRFLQYINEKQFDNDSIIALLKQHCKQYLKELSHCNGLLYRAVWHGGEKVSIVNKPTNRKSFRTNQEFQNTIDNEFVKKFGIALRENTFSCCGNINTIKQYGIINAIFPIGGFEIFWSPRVKDFYLNAFDSRNNQALAHKNIQWAQRMAETYIKGDLNKAIQSGNEVMIYCNKAMLIPIESISFKMIINPFITDLQRGL